MQQLKGRPGVSHLMSSCRVSQLHLVALFLVIILAFQVYIVALLLRMRAWMDSLGHTIEILAKIFTTSQNMLITLGGSYHFFTKINNMPIIVDVIWRMIIMFSS